MASLYSCGVACCMCAFVRLREVLAVTWQTEQGGAARGSFITVGGAMSQ